MSGLRPPDGSYNKIWDWSPLVPGVGCLAKGIGHTEDSHCFFEVCGPLREFRKFCSLNWGRLLLWKPDGSGYRGVGGGNANWVGQVFRESARWTRILKWIKLNNTENWSNLIMQSLFPHRIMREVDRDLVSTCTCQLSEKKAPQTCSRSCQHFTPRESCPDSYPFSPHTEANQFGSSCMSLELSAPASFEQIRLWVRFPCTGPLEGQFQQSSISLECNPYWF